MLLTLPKLCFVALVGVTSSGKSTFARKHFKPSEVLSMDAFRAMVSDDRASNADVEDAVDVLHFIAAKRLAKRRLTVVDATNRKLEHRQRLLATARAFEAPTVALLFDLPEALLMQRYAEREHRYVARSAIEHALLRHVGPRMVQVQLRQIGSARKSVLAEGFDAEYRFTSPEEVEAVRIERR